MDIETVNETEDFFLSYGLPSLLKKIGHRPNL